MALEKPGKLGEFFLLLPGHSASAVALCRCSCLLESSVFYQLESVTCCIASVLAHLSALNWYGISLFSLSLFSLLL